jgi:hypothetical protein
MIAFHSSHYKHDNNQFQFRRRTASLSSFTTLAFPFSSCRIASDAVQQRWRSEGGYVPLLIITLEDGMCFLFPNEVPLNVPITVVRGCWCSLSNPTFMIPVNAFMLRSPCSSSFTSPSANPGSDNYLTARDQGPGNVSPPSVGTAIGLALGLALGPALGNALYGMGDILGPALGTALGVALSLSLGDELGASLGAISPSIVGKRLGKVVGALLWEQLGDTDGPTLGEALGDGELVGPLVFWPRFLPLLATSSIFICSVRSYVNGLVPFALDVLLIGPLGLAVRPYPRL